MKNCTCDNQSRVLFLSVSATIFCENFVTNVDMHGRFARWRKWKACEVREAKELILQPFRYLTYFTAHSPTLPSLYLRHSSFSNSSVASPTSQLILQPFFRFSYVTGSSLTSPGEPPTEIWVVRMKINLVVTPQWNKPPLSLSQKWRRG